MRKEYRIPIMIPNTICTGTHEQECVFCDRTRKESPIGEKEVVDTINYYLQSYAQEEPKQIEVAFWGGNFTDLAVETQEILLKAVYTFIQKGEIHSICFVSRPDTLQKKYIKMYKKYKVKTIEMMAVSSNQYVLEKAQVGYTWEQVKKASRWLKFAGVKLGYQMMIGLPESTKLDERNTALAFIKQKPYMVRIYPVLVVKGSPLESQYAAQDYHPLPLVQAVERCKEVANLCNIHRIPVIKIGAQNTEGILELKAQSSQVVAGPYHPEFRQLVEGAMWYDAIVEEIKKINTKVKQVEIKANPQDIPNIMGFQNGNVHKLREIYDVDVVITPQEESVRPGKFEVSVAKTYDEILEEERMQRDKS